MVDMKGTDQYGLTERHPLFRIGILHLLDVKDQERVRIVGFYNPVIDSVFLADANYEVEQHEVAHRVFAVGLGGFDVLRRLAGFSYILLYALFNIAAREKVQFVGRNLKALRYVGSPSCGPFLDVLIDRLKFVEGLSAMCFRALTPVAEIAAIDCAPGKWDHKWIPQRIPNTDPSTRKRKIDLIDAVARQFPKDFGGYQLQHGSFQTAFRTVWEAYSSIENPDIAKALLRWVMSAAVLPDDPSDPSNYMVTDTLAMILTNAPTAQKGGKEALVLLTLMTRANRDQVDALLEWLAKDILRDIPDEYHIVGSLPQLIEDLLWSSHPGVNAIPLFPGLRHTFEMLNDPRNALLVFRINNDGKRLVSLNQGYQRVLQMGWLVQRPRAQEVDSFNQWLGEDILEELAYSETMRGEPLGNPDVLDIQHSTMRLDEDNQLVLDLPDGRKLYPDRPSGPPVIKEDWWAALAFLETLRQALVTDLPVKCPFLDWKGVNCKEECQIRRWIRRLSEDSELTAQDAVCSL